MLEPILVAVFDPAWNATHRWTIWSCIIGVLFVSGFGIPFPEDIPLVLSGFTTYKQAGDQVVLWHYVVTFLTVVVPILAGDLVAYGMGRRFGWALRRFAFFARILDERRMDRVRHWYEHYGSFTVFLGRQVAGVRFVTFYSAGTMRMNVGKFLFWDFLGCLVSVPVWLILGTLAAVHGRPWLEAASANVGRVFFVVVLLLTALLIWKARSRARDEAKRAD